MGKETLYIPLAEGAFYEFMPANIAERIEALVDKYNTERLTVPYDIVNVTVGYLGECCYSDRVYEFARVVNVLLFAREGKHSYKSDAWGMSSYGAFEEGDLEICRELLLRNIKENSKNDATYRNKALIPLSKETEDDNVADIMGMITDELGAIGEIDNGEYDELLEDLASLLVRWRALHVPKHKDGDAFEILYGIVQKCYEHKAYHTALKLLPLLYVVDEPKKRPNFIVTNILAGQVLLELGYKEPARRCFLSAARDNSKKRRPPFPEEYLPFLEEKTQLEVPDEVYKIQKSIDDGIASGKIKAYTKEERKQYKDGKLKIEFPDSKKQENERQKIAEKALNTYEKHSDGDSKERLKGIDAAFKIFTEEPEVYEQAAYLYFQKANIYLEEDDLEKAYDCIKKAYKCKNGNRNSMVLLCTAIILSKMERHSEATVYIFRSYILYGEEFVTEKLGDGAMEALEDYL